MQARARSSSRPPTGLGCRPGALRLLAARVRRDFAAMFPAWAGIEIDREWSGLVCLTGSLTPFAGLVPGTELEVISRGRGPVIISVNSNRLILGYGMASKIEVA